MKSGENKKTNTYSLTTPQTNIWNLQKYYEKTSLSNICGSVIYDVNYDYDILNNAINAVIACQEALRLRIGVNKGNVEQYSVTAEHEDFLYLKFRNADELKQHAVEMAHTPMNLIDQKLYHIEIICLNGKNGILVCLNHLIADAWSFAILARMVEQNCVSYANKQEYRYSAYAENERSYLSSKRYTKDQEFWENTFRDKVEVCSIKPETTPTVIPTADKYTFGIGKNLSDKIKGYCKENILSPAVLFEGALFTYLSKLNPEYKELVIGNVVLNRSTLDEKSTVGMFISTLPLKISISQDMTVSELLEYITATHTKIFRHQKYPYRNIAEYARQKYGMDSLYQVMFSYQNAKTEINAETEWYSNGYSEVPFVLHVDDRDSTSEYTLTVDYQTDIFKQEEIEYICKRLIFIIKQMITTPALPLAEINIIPSEEYQKLIYDFNDTAVEYPRNKCVHELFTEQVKRTPDKTALIFEDIKFSYKQLDEMSNSLAHYLREEAGVKPNDIVPIIAKRSWHIIVAMFSILKAGGAYMPVDPTYPVERIQYMMKEANAYFALAFDYSNDRIHTLDLSGFDYQYDISDIKFINISSDTCYCICTSGSTGLPKGVLISHYNVVNYANDYHRNIVIDRIIKSGYNSILSVTNIVFDIFVTESLMPLANGLTIYLANDEEVSSQRSLARLIMRSERIDVMQTTPTKMRGYMLDENNLEYLKSFKAIILGGEALTSDLASELKACTDAEIFNIYGPAETTVWATNAIVDPVDITIGKPIANTQIYILDRNRRILPIGIAGELCISGDGVGKGYLNNPKLTAEKFIPDPFREGQTMYCTGDLARWRTDGEIEYLGRIDTQVKIRGLRIELGEIESVMSSFRGISLCAVTDKRDENNRQYLVGYYTADTEIDEKALRKHLSAKLPKYMIPNYFVCLDAMPMTASGKTDRKNLPLPDFSQGKGEFVAPRNETEQKLCALMSELLNVDNIGITDDFFDLGGDSLLAITMLSEIENRFEVSISVTDIYDNPNVERLTAVIANADRRSSIPVLGNTKYELLPQQKAIYAYCRKYPDSLAYNMPAFIPIPDGFDKKKIQDCFTKLVKLHPELCTRIITENNSLFGVYDTMTRPILEEYQNDFMCFLRPFDLSTDCLIRIGFTKGGLLFDIHHIIADGTTLDIILRDLMCLLSGSNPADKSISYADYSAYFYNADFSKHKAFFKNMLRCDFEPIILPEKKNTKSGNGVSAYYTLDSKTVKAAKTYAVAHGLTDTMIFFGVWTILLSKYTAKEEVLTSLILTNRVHGEIQNTVGMFVNTLPVYLKTEGQTLDFFSQVKDVLLGVYKYQELPFFDIAETVGMTDKNVINTSFVYQADGEKKLMINENEIVPQMLSTNTAKFDLTFELTPQTDKIMIRAEYNSGKYDAELIQRLFEAFSRIIAQLDTPMLCDVSVLSEQEYRQVIYDFNDTAVDYPQDKCVHELFTEQAKKTPDKTALIFENRKFTYRQLDEMSNSLAHYLREKKGVKPNEIVPIIGRRSWHIIVAILGIMKAGAAYLPIDPNYPQDRIKTMLSESKAKLILAYNYNHSFEIEVVSLDSISYQVNTLSIGNLNNSGDYCYAMFTSGSTGKPKAVSITHQNLVNFVNNNPKNAYQYNMLQNCSTSIALTTFSFDISVFEIFISLLNGMQVVLTNDEETLSAYQLAHLIYTHKVDVVHTTPTKFLMYLKDAYFQKSAYQIKTLMIGAERFTADIYNKISAYTNAEIFNGYGPTETTIGVSFKRIYRDVCIHSLFAKQVEKSPEKTALVFENRIFTYKQLDEMSNSLAHYLRDEMGIRQNDIVPIIAKRSWHIIVAMLGILKAGGAYMPVDPTYPVDRILYMMSDARSAFALAYGFENSEVCCMNLEEFNYSSNILPIQSINTINDLCYLIFTSDSTGKPKSVKITHANAANYVNNNNNNVVNKIIKSRFKSIVSVTNIIFDIFVTESLMPLANGLTIYLANDEEVSSQRSLARLVMRSEKIDVMQTTPTKMRGYMLDENNLEYLKSFKAIILGGEGLTSDLASELKACTNAEIFNIYGPAETTVWTTNAAVNPVDITIGKPIANTQIYILDHNRKPLPIGVAGELCISGDSVGKGYLNNTELTLEKFVPNPFIEGKTMYCTGDLARWRADGEIEYLGRIDTQVKIRGLRIELGEIESVMSSFEGISLCAVTDKRYENNRQYLVGYYTADTQIDEKALRKHLSAKLPKYMIPNYFVRLDAMPMTASGKTDRKNMPLPDFSLCKGEYVAPRNEIEQKLCALMSDLLNIENVGITDDFFDLGGDSLGAMTFIAEAHNEGIEISLQNLYDHPTVESLLDESKTSIAYSAEQFAKYEEILQRNKTGEESFSKESLGNVLLTGATGFLGSHALDVLMKQESGKVFCLVRSKEKFIDTLHYYFEELYDDNDRIIPIEGDITDGHLSDILPCDVHTIIHTAANVKHYGAYSEFMKVNVGGTKNLIEYAKSIHAKLIHISTISVSGNTFADAFTAYRAEKEMQFDEGCLYIGQSLENVYVRSKFEAECAVLDAILDGLDARIIRIGNLTNRSSDYKFQPNHENNAFLTRVCAGLKLGVLPDYLLPLYAEFSPVDDTAEGIVRIAQYARKQTIFHLNSNRPIYFTRLIEILHELGIKMEIVSGNEFGKRLEEMNHESNTQYLYKAFQNDIDKDGNLTYDSNIRILNDITVNFLNATGFEWTDIDLDYIKGYIEYFREIGILEV